MPCLSISKIYHVLCGQNGSKNIENTKLEEGDLSYYCINCKRGLLVLGKVFLIEIQHVVKMVLIQNSKPISLERNSFHYETKFKRERTSFLRHHTKTHCNVSASKITTQDETIIKSWNDLNSSKWPTPGGNQIRTARFDYQCVFSRRRIMGTVFLCRKLSVSKELFPIDTDTDCVKNP